MGHRACGGAVELEGGPAGVVGDGLLEEDAELAFDEGEGEEERAVGDFDGEEAGGVGVAGGDAVFGEGAGGAGELDAVGAETGGEGGELGIGHGNLDHPDSVRQEGGASALFWAFCEEIRASC